MLVKDINPGKAAIYPGGPLVPRSSRPAGLTYWNGVIYFQADNGVNGVELWKSDGIAKGTVRVKELWTYA